MKKYKNIVVTGCSFSAGDYNDENGTFLRNGKTYGDLIAKHFQSKFYNLAYSGHSIQYMTRSIYNWCSENTEKYKDTLIILGVTGAQRYEIWSNRLNKWHRIHGDHVGSFYDDLGRTNGPDGDVPEKTMEFKMSRIELKKWYLNFHNNMARFIISENYLIGLSSFLQLNKIDHVFFDALTNHRPVLHHGIHEESKWSKLLSMENWYKHPKYLSMAHFTDTLPDMRVTGDLYPIDHKRYDNHPNEKCHKYWAKCLLEYINE